MDRTAMLRADRLNELRGSASKMKPAELAAAASAGGISFVGDETREEMEFAIAEAVVTGEEKAAAQAAADQAAAEEREKREAFYQTKEGRKQRAIDEAVARDNAIRRVNHGFISALPQSARMKGTHQPDPSAPSADHPVPDGSYRVSGSGWVLTFKDGKFVSADAAHNRAQPHWSEIPDVAGGQVSAKPDPKKVVDY